MIFAIFFIGSFMLLVELTESKPSDKGAGIIISTGVAGGNSAGRLDTIRIRPSSILKGTSRKHVLEVTPPDIGLCPRKFRRHGGRRTK